MSVKKKKRQTPKRKAQSKRKGRATSKPRINPKKVSKPRINVDWEKKFKDLVKIEKRLRKKVKEIEKKGKEKVLKVEKKTKKIERRLKRAESKRQRNYKFEYEVRKARKAWRKTLFLDNNQTTFDTLWIGPKAKRRKLVDFMRYDVGITEEQFVNQARLAGYSEHQAYTMWYS